MTPTARRRKEEAAQRTKKREERMKKHLEDMQRIYKQNENDHDKSMKDATESNQDKGQEMSEKMSSGRCQCGYSNINECLNCRIEQNVPSSVNKPIDTTHTTEPDEHVKAEAPVDDNAKNKPDMSTQKIEDLPDHTFDVRGQVVQVPHLTQVYFLEQGANYPPHLATYEVRGCMVGVLHGTSVRFL